ncbi:MAG TPA: dickkopf-related protein [Archangium sp.]|uniref:dickkopf-related protein n=1 Tax=Archangium sp. TaxID=1872627 RepID=UPI002E32CB90|nr:dickkopf-related protein [Archangium sp.]HEX5748196.1 dickkopf-related protein [Archangium sp.]
MRLGRLLVVVWVWGGALFQVGCSGCGDPPVTYGLPGGPGELCADGLRNGDELDVDCGGSCQPCVGRDDTSGPSGCTESACAAPTCTDGVKNGSETGVDCGGGCPACAEGESCGGDTDCSSSLLCLESVCARCREDAHCGAGFACRAGVCVEDDFAPRVQMAFLPGSTVLRVRFSEPMVRDESAASMLNPDNYCVELTDETPHECTPSDAFWLGTELSLVDPNTVDIQLPFAPGNGRYTVHVSGVVDRAANGLGSPRHADFEVGAPLRLMSATTLVRDRVVLTFSRPMQAGPDVPGSAGCSSSATCASRYQLTGASALGAVLSARVLAPPRDNEVLLTHASAQRGGQYTVRAAELQSVWGERLGASPLDRVTFTGFGPLVSTWQDGPVQVDPFADGVSATSAVAYRGRMYLGPNADGTRAVGMDQDGVRPDDLAFRFRKDTQKLAGSRSSNAAGAPFPSIGFAGCRENSYQCGPDNEDGRARFAAGSFGATEWLMMSGSRSGGGLDYVYMSRDDDATLDMKYVDLGQALEGMSARSFSALGILEGRTYLGVPLSGDARRPGLLALLRAPAETAEGLEARSNGTGACNPASHDVCNLAAHRMPGIGAAGSPANPARTVGIDFVGEFNGKLYLGNNGGLVRATVQRPLDYESSPAHWVSITPSAPEYRAKQSLTTDKDMDLEPSDRAWSRMAVFNGHVYLGRNTPEGPQLWRCDPERVSGPAPATAYDCDAGDWVLVAGNGKGDGQLSQFDNPRNTRLTLLAINRGYLYVGFDNAVDGAVVYRSAVEVPASRSDFTGQGGCVASTAGCAGLGGNGFGQPSVNTRLGDAVTLVDGERGFLYVPVSGGPGTPVRLYRQQD